MKDGYLDTVKFSIRGLSAQAGTVGLVGGKAVLTLKGKTVKTWKITKSTTALVWNGRVGKHLRVGMYKLSLTAWSADGTVKKASTTITVMPQHLVTQTVMAKSKLSPTAVKGVMPKAVAQAFAKGKVTVRVRTVAVVHGKARLIFTDGGVQRSIVLHNGTHTTKALVVPKGFKIVKITHQWKKGAAKLISYTNIWTYKKLVR